MRASAISRSVRRRRFSISASTRRSLSLYSAATLAWSLGSIVLASEACEEGSRLSGSSPASTDGRAFVSVITLFPLAIEFAPDIRVERPKIKPQCATRVATSPSDELAHDFRGVIDHRNHAGIIEPSGTDHADDAAGAVAVRGDDGGRAREREQLVLRADEDTGAVGMLGAPEQIDQAALGLEIVEQQPHPLEVLERLEVVEQVRRAAHNQLALVALAARPARQAGGDDLLGELIDLRLAGCQRLLQLGLGLRQRAAAHMGVEEVRRLGEGRPRQSGRNADDPVLDLPVVRDQDDERTLGLEPYEFDVLEAHVRL